MFQKIPLVPGFIFPLCATWLFNHQSMFPASSDGNMIALIEMTQKTQQIDFFSCIYQGAFAVIWYVYHFIQICHNGPSRTPRSQWNCHFLSAQNIREKNERSKEIVSRKNTFCSILSEVQHNPQFHYCQTMSDTFSYFYDLSWWSHTHFKIPFDLFWI